ncbi:CRISPR-associated endonuclease Cas2, partial [Candidatus Calescamantes bacterium]|nr:CRISPR-associated endonuclease Cas2 [Candidatus Calescamantes bacterium]
MFIVISYDITDDRRRDRIAKTLENYGKRVQYSVFECNLDKPMLEMMIKEVSSIMNEDEDSVRIYRLCEECKGKIKLYGKGEVTREEDVYIV